METPTAQTSSRPGREPGADVLVWVLFAGLLLCLLLVARQHFRFSDLEEQSLSAAAELGEKIRELENANAALLARLQTLEAAAAAKVVEEKPQFDPRRAARMLAGLQPGLYTLEKEVETEDVRRTKERRLYSIYHFKTSVGAGSASYDINLGLATSSYTIPRFYIDYDNDGRVDTDIMHEYVGYLPFGKLMSKSIDPYISQAIYADFISNYSRARYTSAKNIQSEGGEIASKIWSVIEGSSAEIAAWIRKRLDAGAEAGGSATSPPAGNAPEPSFSRLP